MALFGRRRPLPSMLQSATAESDWVLPIGASAGGGPAAALADIGTVGSGWSATVDSRGLVSVPFGHPGGVSWSLDWWVGADDRWHLPSKDAAVRQRLIGGAPVVETRLRIPNGDAVHRAFAVRGPAYPGGDEYLVVEVENESPLPFAIAFVLRPFGADGRPVPLGPISVAPMGDGTGGDAPHAVHIGDRVVMSLPRKPARAAGSSDGNDIAELVTSGAAPDELGDAAGAADSAVGMAGRTAAVGMAGRTAAVGMAGRTAAVLFPVPHTARMRVLLPLGVEPGTEPPHPTGLPDAERVASGWAIQTRRGARVEPPDTGMTEGIAASRATLLLASGVDVAQGDGGRIDPDLVLGLDHEGWGDEAAAVLRNWPERLRRISLDPATSTAALRSIADHWRMSRDTDLARELLPEISALAGAVQHVVGRSSDPQTRGRQREALVGLALMLDAMGQPDAAAAARADVDRLAVARAGEAGPGDAVASAVAAAATGPIEAPAWRSLRQRVSAASPSWAWPEGRLGAVDLLASVRAVVAVEDENGVALLPSGLGPWWGQAIEAHELPFRAGLLSFAIRWHDQRPALLWEFEPHGASDTVALTCPILDPAWHTSERRGEALLAVVPRPAGFAEPRASTVPDELGHAEAVAPRSVLPLDRGESERDKSAPTGETGPHPPDSTGTSFS